MTGERVRANPPDGMHASFGGIHHLYANDKAQAGYRRSGGVQR